MSVLVSVDYEGYKMTIEFKKNNHTSTVEEYKNYMLSKGRTKYGYD